MGGFFRLSCAYLELCALPPSEQHGWMYPTGDVSVWWGSGDPWAAPRGLGAHRTSQAALTPLLSPRRLPISSGKVGNGPWSSTRAVQCSRSGHKRCWTWPGSPWECPPLVPAMAQHLPSPRPPPTLPGGVKHLFPQCPAFPRAAQGSDRQQQRAGCPARPWSSVRPQSRAAPGPRCRGLLVNKPAASALPPAAPLGVKPNTQSSG